LLDAGRPQCGEAVAINASHLEQTPTHALGLVDASGRIRGGQESGAPSPRRRFYSAEHIMSAEPERIDTRSEAFETVFRSLGAR
jgi:hypothetical protein